MYEHAQMQKAVTEAFTFQPSYLGLLAEDHWLAQFQDMDVDLEDDDFFPENGSYLARGESDVEWFFAWKLANGRLMVARALYPEFTTYDGADVMAEILPAGTSEQVAMDWVKTRSIEGSYASADDLANDDGDTNASDSLAEFTESQRRIERPASSRANGRQPTFWERLLGRD